MQIEQLGAVVGPVYYHANLKDAIVFGTSVEKGEGEQDGFGWIYGVSRKKMHRRPTSGRSMNFWLYPRIAGALHILAMGPLTLRRSNELQRLPPPERVH